MLLVSQSDSSAKSFHTEQVHLLADVINELEIEQNIDIGHTNN
jgi:hypothetical protein